ncbi:hypothetical protein M2480_001830 [Parabacteroides sp. PFB2-12]|uniref:hypothetical protein n=1 Tax=Parabacteroides sp. PFB2-12 TaxID=2940652 RepID=UPI0024758398|nr:hypothetical protein [Parabacteroides sp. PFB2-12]MDH6390848.1 hypothetical protein [Parabacteroides sp. PFB2-12]
MRNKTNEPLLNTTARLFYQGRPGPPPPGELVDPSVDTDPLSVPFQSNTSSVSHEYRLHVNPNKQNKTTFFI